MFEGKRTYSETTSIPTRSFDQIPSYQLTKEELIELRLKALESHIVLLDAAVKRVDRKGRDAACDPRD